MVGNGEIIRVFEDTWFRSKKNYIIENIRTDRTCVVKVCDLFIPGDKKWDAQKVNNLFFNCDAEAILTTPTPTNQVNDRIAWTSDIDGKYSVKSGYKHYHLQHNNNGYDVHEHDWKNL